MVYPLLKFLNNTRYLSLFLLVGFMIGTIPFSAKVPMLSIKDISSPPPRIIRMCCSFGSDLHITAIPIKTITNITSIEDIGPHHYLGDREEGNGIIYTRRGGFIDMGHLRDQADWTAYLYALILLNRDNGEVSKELGHEGGEKRLTLEIPAGIDSLDAILLSGRIAYDLSVWHEIATWFGASYIPMIPERYSSFSVEDIYSNLLGVTIGMEALKSELPYEEAMTQIISYTLDTLGAVSTVAETYMAMEAVENVWWTRNKRLPSEQILLERNLEVYSNQKPWLVPGLGNNISSYELQIPERTRKGLLLSNLYQLTFRLNYKFPFRKMFPFRIDRNITQNDFDVLIKQVAQDLKNRNAHNEKYTKSQHHKKKKIMS